MSSKLVREVKFAPTALVYTSSGMVGTVHTKTQDGPPDRFNLLVSRLLERPYFLLGRTVSASNPHLPHLKHLLSWIASSPSRQWLCEQRTADILFGKQRRLDYVKDLVDGLMSVK